MTAASCSAALEAIERRWQDHALPIDTHALVLYYNKSIAAKAGLLDEQGKLKPITRWHSSTRRSRASKVRAPWG